MAALTWIKNLVWSAIFLLASPGVFAQCRQDNGADKAYQEGKALAVASQPDGGGSKSDFSAGITRLESAVNLDPNCVEALQALAETYWNGSFLYAVSEVEAQEWRSRSRSLLHQAIAQDPGRSELYYTLALQGGDPTETVSLLRKAIELDSKDPQKHETLARLLLVQGAVEEAVQEFKLHLALNPPPERWPGGVGFGVELARLGSTAEGAKIILQVLELARGESRFEQCRLILPVEAGLFEGLADFQAKLSKLKMYCFSLEHRDRGVELLRQGKTDEAITEFEKQLKVNPVYAESYFLLEKAYRSKGEAEKALGVIERFLDVERDPKQRCEAMKRFGVKSLPDKVRERFRDIEDDCGRK